jgi:hypothetical protein
MRPGTVDLYLAYCDELATWCRHFGLVSVAQTETALWTFAEFVKLSDSDVGAAEASRDFDEHMWVQREQAAQVIRPFFRRYGRLQLAQALLDEDPIVAGKIAAEEYERSMSHLVPLLEFNLDETRLTHRGRIASLSSKASMGGRATISTRGCKNASCVMLAV